VVTEDSPVDAGIVKDGALRGTGVTSTSPAKQLSSVALSQAFSDQQGAAWALSLEDGDGAVAADGGIPSSQLETLGALPPIQHQSRPAAFLHALQIKRESLHG